MKNRNIVKISEPEPVPYDPAAALSALPPGATIAERGRPRVLDESADIFDR